MLLSENYVQYVKEMAPKSFADYELISLDDLALLPRKGSLSETSSNGIGSHDSGHDSYLDDGTGYSGDDEGSGRCDICTTGMEVMEKPNEYQNRKRNRQSRKSRSRRHLGKSKENRDTVVTRELPRTDNFEFEGEKRVEMKWTLECFLNIDLVPELKRVVIDRGRPEDLGVDNLMVFDESSSYSRIQSWRRDVFDKLNVRNQNEAKEYNIFPTCYSCDSCTEQRQKVIHSALGQGKELKLPREQSPYSFGLINKSSRVDSTNMASWRKKIMYDLKLNNCRALACLRAVKRESIFTTSYSFGKSRKRRGAKLERVDEEKWEVYEVISDEEFLNVNSTL